MRAVGESFEETSTSAQGLATFVEKMKMLTVVMMVKMITTVTTVMMGMMVKTMIPMSSSNCPGNAFQRDPREIEDAPYQDKVQGP